LLGLGLALGLGIDVVGVRALLAALEAVLDGGTTTAPGPVFAK
jgi:hypothetical protein